MAMIKCVECGKEISDKATTCVGCGAPVSISMSHPTPPSSGSAVLGDLNGDGKVDFEDFKIALSRSKQYASEKVDDAISFGREKLRSAKERDAAVIDKLYKDSGSSELVKGTESQVNRDRFKAALESTIDVRFADIMRSKKESEVYLTFIDAQILTASVRNVFKTALGVTPPQVEASLLLSEAILAPSVKEKEGLIKGAVGVAGGASGIGMVIGGIGSALGWGSGAIAGVGAWFAGTSISGPVGWVVAGLSLAAIAGYFASTSSKQTDTERFLAVLKKSTGRAVDAIWEQFESEFSSVLNQAKPLG